MAALATRSLVQPAPVQGASGDALVLGQINESADPTRIYTPGFPTYDRSVILNGSAAAVAGGSQVDNGSGVRGFASGSPGIGVDGSTDGHFTTIGVRGLAEPEGIGVMGRSVNGTGVHAEITGGGYALNVRGRAVFNRSGKLTFSTGQASRSVTRSGAVNFLSSDSIIVATIQGYANGTWVAGVRIDSDSKFTLRLNRAAPTQLVVGFFIVN